MGRKVFAIIDEYNFREKPEKRHNSHKKYGKNITHSLVESLRKKIKGINMLS